MAKYHGDMMHQMGTIHHSTDDRNYPVAILLAFFLGGMGVHRFFLNDTKLGLCYIMAFAIACFVSFATLSLSVLVTYLSIAGLIVLCEILYFGFKWANR